jgi:hypothetical protein
MIVNAMDAIHQIFANWKHLTNYFFKANAYIKTIDSFKLDCIKIKSLPINPTASEKFLRAFLRGRLREL